MIVKMINLMPRTSFIVFYHTLSLLDLGRISNENISAVTPPRKFRINAKPQRTSFQ